MASRPEYRFSTYSGAPSLQPSLAATWESNSTRSAVPSKHSGVTYVPVTEKKTSSTTMSISTSSATTSDPRRPSSAFYATNGPNAALTSSSTLSASSDPKAADIRSWGQGFDRMQDARLDKQRYIMSGVKSEEVSKLALGAKLERALGRRMTGQDATFSPKKPSSSLVSKEKSGAWEVECR